MLYGALSPLSIILGSLNLLSSLLGALNVLSLLLGAMKFLSMSIFETFIHAAWRIESFSDAASARLHAC